MSIEQLAMATRINARFIEALESGRRDQLPGQVYLKPFVKTCAEVLDLDLKELYKIIDGETEKGNQGDLRIEFQDEKKKRREYKLPVVLLIAAAIMAIIYFTVKNRDKMPPKTEITEIIPADATKIRDKINWDRPWEQPAFFIPGSRGQNLVLMPSDNISAFILSGDDTLFSGILPAGEKKTFLSEDGFVLSLTRNDHITGYINGRRDSIIGSGGGRLENYRIGEGENR